MDIDELVLLLAATSGIGDRALARILRRSAVLRRAPDEFLRTAERDLLEAYGLKPEQAHRVASVTQADLEAAAVQARNLRRMGVHIVTLLDAAYPRALVERLEDPPAALYLYGAPGLLSRPLFAVANSNRAPEQALAAADSLARAAVRQGMAPVTGTNRPAYQRPALVARRAAAPVCYVLDRGVLEEFASGIGVEPVRAARVWQPTYDTSRDLTLSCFAPSHHALAAYHRRRDEIVFSLASCVIAGHVRPGGEMERQCRAVLQSGRPVLLATKDGPSHAALLKAGATEIDPQDEQTVAAALSAAATAPDTATM